MMPVRSSDNSFVNFNVDVTDCSGATRQAALPAYDNFGIKFQFRIEDENLPSDTVLKAAVCSVDCDILMNPSVEAVPICSRWAFTTSVGLLTADKFPIIIGNYAPQPGQPQLPEGEYSVQEFLDVINDLYETSIQALDYISCCEEVTISGIVATLSDNPASRNISLGEYYSSGYVNFPATSMGGLVDIGECFRYCILDEDNTVLRCSNLFTRISDDCKTTLFRYWNDESAYGFNYATYEDGGETLITENTIRLWANFSFPEYVIEENTIRQPNGVYRRTSTTIDDQWRGQTAPLSKQQRDQLVIMLKHDYLYVYNEESGIDGFMTQIGTPEVIYTQPYRRPMSMVEFDIIYQKNNNVNRNCGGDCGIEIIDDCAGGGGGVIIPCPDKYSVQFQSAGSQPTYQDNNLIGKSQLNVYREGLLQYLISSDYSFNSGTGTVTFNPELYENERVAIWEA